MTRTSKITVAVQLICLAVLIATGPILPRHGVLQIMAAAGVIIIVWAVATMGLYNVRVEPDLPEHARLVTGGPYRWIRHPMYTGGVLISLAWLFSHFTVWRLLVILILFANFFVKLRYEERLLAARFPVYENYMRHTKRLIPFVY